MAQAHAARPGPTPEPAQVMRELVRPRVELAVGQLPVLEYDRHRVGRARHLRLEQLVHAGSRG